MIKIIKKYDILLIVGMIVIVLDQITKLIVRANIYFGGQWAPWSNAVEPFLRIVHWKNTGAAFGLFQNANTLFIVLAFIIAGVLIYFYPQLPQDQKWMRIALGLQFGGAVGNLIDRISIGHVTDFIAVGDFPVFNIADSGITVGTAILLLMIWLSDRQEKKQQTAQIVEDSSEQQENSSSANEINEFQTTVKET